jgi:hypothetical protein
VEYALSGGYDTRQYDQYHIKHHGWMDGLNENVPAIVEDSAEGGEDRITYPLNHDLPE